MPEEELKQKRERIRAIIMNTLLRESKLWWETAGELMNTLNAEGVKIVDEKAELPSNPFRDISFQQAVGWDCGKSDMLKGGFQKTHPLIGESK